MTETTETAAALASPEPGDCYFFTDDYRYTVAVVSVDADGVKVMTGEGQPLDDRIYHGRRDGWSEPFPDRAIAHWYATAEGFRDALGDRLTLVTRGRDVTGWLARARKMPDAPERGTTTPSAGEVYADLCQLIADYGDDERGVIALMPFAASLDQLFHEKYGMELSP